MEEKQGKGNAVLLTVLGIATLLVAVIGATFAYFSASQVSGNSQTNNITATTATYGNTSVHFDIENGYGELDTGLIDLPKLDRAVDYSWLMKFRVTTTATTPQQMTISWKNVENSFCQYQVGTTTTCSANAGICLDGEGHDIYSGTVNTQTTCENASGNWTANTLRSDELFYDLYSCTQTAWTDSVANNTDHIVTIDPGCTKISASPTSPFAPISESSNILHSEPSLLLAAGGTNYYALVLSMKNLNAPQDYNQGKSFSGTVDVKLIQST